MQDAIADFRRYLDRRYPGRSTRKHYISDLTIFQRFVGDVSPQAVTARTIDQFVQRQSDQGLKATTINRRLSAIASLFEFLIGQQPTTAGAIPSPGRATASGPATACPGMSAMPRWSSSWPSSPILATGPCSR